MIAKFSKMDYNPAMETSPYLKRIRIVLVDTQDGANIGSCCRAMKTMGIERLVGKLVHSCSYPSQRQVPQDERIFS